MSNFKVVVRVRPLSDSEKSKFSQPAIELGDDSSIVVHNAKLERRKSGLADSRCRMKKFYFDKIYWSVDLGHPLYASQKMVYDDLSPDLLDHVFGGYNVCLFAYGQTGAGKTYTMMGNEEDPGFIPRLCEEMFNKTSQCVWEERTLGENVSFNISVSYMEIYNEKVYDLLESVKSNHQSLTRRHDNKNWRGYLQQHRHLHHNHRHHHQHHHPREFQKHLRVREHPKTGPYVEDLSQHTVKDNLSIQKLIKRGNIHRKTASTRAHTCSSRSHAIFSITFTQANLDAEHPMERRSKINLVDLAGSERADSSTEMDKLRMKEGSDINKSLATLGSVIQALAQRSLLLTWSIPSFSPAPPSSKSSSPLPHHRRSNNSISKSTTGNNNNSNDAVKHKFIYIPYRDSTLTWILKDSLEGNAVSVMIAAISPSSCSYFETINTLYYGQRAKTIVNKPVVNEDPVTKLICDLKAEIKRLKTLLSDQQNQSDVGMERRSGTVSGINQADKSVSPCQMMSGTECDLSEQLKMDEVKVDILTRDFLEKWRRMEDSDVEITPLNSSTIEIFTNVPHLVSLQEEEEGEEDYEDGGIGIRIFKLHDGDTTINLSEMIPAKDDKDDDVDDDGHHDGSGGDGSHSCVFRNRDNVITIFPPSPPPPSSSSTSSPSSSSSSSSFRVYVNDVLVEEPYKPKQGDVIRFGKRLKFKFVNPYMTPRKTKRRKRSLVTSHKSHVDIHPPISPHPPSPSSSSSFSSSFLRCSSLNSMPVISVGRLFNPNLSADLELRGSIGDIGSQKDAPSIGRDGSLTPTAMSSVGLEEIGKDGLKRNEMELQISALEKAWSLCLEKEAEMRMTHEKNKGDLDRRIEDLRMREEKLRLLLESQNRTTREEMASHKTEQVQDQSLRSLPKVIKDQLEFEREAILRLEKDYRERDERMCEEVRLMHHQIEMLKAQLESLTSKSHDKLSGDDHINRGFFLQQIRSRLDPFQGSLPSKLNSFDGFGSQLEFTSALELRSEQVSRLSKSLDSISAASCDDSLECTYSSLEVADLSSNPNATGFTMGCKKSSENLESSRPHNGCWDVILDSVNVESEQKLKYAKRLSPVGSEYENLNKSFSDLPLTESPKHLSPAEVVGNANFINATVAPAPLNHIWCSPKPENFEENSNKRSRNSKQNGNDSDFSDFSTDSLDHRKNPAITSSRSVIDVHQKLVKKSEPEGFSSPSLQSQYSDSKGDSGADCNSSSTGDGNSGKDEEEEFYMEKTLSATDVSFIDVNTDNSEENREVKLDDVALLGYKYSDHNANKPAVIKNAAVEESIQSSVPQCSLDIMDWEGMLDQVSQSSMPLRSTKAKEKSRTKSISTKICDTMVNTKRSCQISPTTFDESSVTMNQNQAADEQGNDFLSSKVDMDSVDKIKNKYSLTSYQDTFESNKLFLSELDAELRRLEEDDSLGGSKTSYFVRGNRLVTVAQDDSKLSYTDNISYENHSSQANPGHSLPLNVPKECDKGESKDIASPVDRKSSDKNMKETAAALVSSIFINLNLKGDQPIKTNHRKIECPKDFTSKFNDPGEFLNPTSTVSNFSCSPTSGSSNGKHVRFRLDESATIPRRKIDVEDPQSSNIESTDNFLCSKRSFLSLEDLHDLNGCRNYRTLSSSGDNGLNLKRHSEDDITIAGGRSIPDLSDFELGKDGRMRMKKHRKRPNLMDIDFSSHDSGSSDIDMKTPDEDTYKYRRAESSYDSISKHSTQSNDSGVASTLNESPIDLVAPNPTESIVRESNKKSSVGNVETNKDFTTRSLGGFRGNLKPAKPCYEDSKKVSIGNNVQSEPVNEGLIEPNEHKFSGNIKTHSLSSQSTTSSHSDEYTSETDVAHISDLSSIGNVSAICDESDLGEIESFLDFKFDECSHEDVDRVNKDDIYRNILSYQSAVAKAEELISDKIHLKQNSPTPLNNFNGALKETGTLQNALTNETSHRVISNHQKSFSDSRLVGSTTNKTNAPSTTNKAVSCDLSDMEIGDSKSTDSQRYFYNKTEVLGFDLYPPMDSFHLHPQDYDLKSVNLVTGSKSQLRFPVPGHGDKEFEYFGLQPVMEVIDPEFIDQESTDDTLMASVLVDELCDSSKLSDLVKCSCSIEIKPNVVPLSEKKFLDDDDDNIVKIADNFSNEIAEFDHEENTRHLISSSCLNSSNVTSSNFEPYLTDQTLPTFHKTDYGKECIGDSTIELTHEGQFYKSGKSKPGPALSETLGLESTETLASSESLNFSALNCSKSDALSRPLKRSEIVIAPKIETVVTSSSAVVAVVEIGGERYRESEASVMLDSSCSFVVEDRSSSSSNLKYNDYYDPTISESKLFPDSGVLSSASPEFHRPRYVSQLSIFLDKNGNRSKPLIDKGNEDIKQGESSNREEAVHSPKVSLFCKTSSGFISDMSFQETSNLAAMSNLSKSDEDLLGEDKNLFEGLMPIYKDLPPSISRGTFYGGLSDCLHPSVSPKDSQEICGDKIVSHEKSDKFLSNQSVNTADGSFQDDTTKPPFERNHSSSLNDLRQYERIEQDPKRQGTYDSIDSITLVLVDPDVDEVCGAETRHYLNGHSSLKNVSQYGVGIHSITDSNADVVHYETDDDEDNTIEAPLVEELTDEEEFVAGVTVEDPTLDLRNADHNVKFFGGEVNCYVLNSENVGNIDEIRDNDDLPYKHYENPYDEVLLPHEEGIKNSLKEFSEVLAFSIPIKNDAQTMKLHQCDREKLNIFSSPRDAHDGYDATSNFFKIDRNRRDVISPGTPESNFVDKFSRDASSTSDLEHQSKEARRTIETQTYPERRVIETQTTPTSDRLTTSEDMFDFTSLSSKPTKDAIYGTFGEKSLWPGEDPKTHSRRSFSKENGEAPRQIFKNNVSTLVTDSDISEGLWQTKPIGESAKTTADEESIIEDFSSYHARKASRRSREKSKSSAAKKSSDNDDVSSPSYDSNLFRMSNSMTEVRTCIEDEFVEPLLFSASEKVNKLRKTVHGSNKPKGKRETEETPDKYSKREKMSNASFEHRKFWFDISKRRDFGGSPIHDSGLEDRYTNTPIWLSDRGSASPGAFGNYHGLRTVRDACTNTDDSNRLHRKAQSLGRLPSSSSTPKNRRQSLKREINRLRREKRRMIEMLAGQVVPSKVQIELSEAQLNYYLGQTDLYLNLLEESTLKNESSRGSQRSHTFDNSLKIDAYEDDISDYPSIRFDPEFISRHCKRLEVSRRRIEERLSNLEQIISGSLGVEKSSKRESSPEESGTGQSQEKVNKNEKRKKSPADTETFIPIAGLGSRSSATRDRKFQSHCDSGLNSPHHTKAIHASPRLDGRSFGSERTDSLHFERPSASEESESCRWKTTRQLRSCHCCFRSPTWNGIGDLKKPEKHVDDDAYGFSEATKRKYETSFFLGHHGRQDGPDSAARIKKENLNFRHQISYKLREKDASSQEEEEAVSFKMHDDRYETSATSRNEMKKVRMSPGALLTD